MQRARGMKKSKKYQLENFLVYSLTALTCSLLCSSPFWVPSFCSSMKVFLFVSLPQLGLVALSPKILFIVGNLIVVILIGESKFFASVSSPASIAYYDEYIKSRGHQNSCTVEEIKEKKLEKRFQENVKKICKGGENIVKRRWVEDQATELEKKRGDEFAITGDELSKRADDFIARVNRRRRLEAGI